MGKKLEQNKQKVEQAKQTEMSGLEKAEKDAGEIREVKSILENAPREVDDDIQAALESTRASAVNEGSNHMQSEVHGELEKGYTEAQNASQEGQAESQKSRQAAEALRSAGSASEFGRSAANEGAGLAEQNAQGFEQNAEQAMKDMEEAEGNFNRLLQEIQS